MHDDADDVGEIRFLDATLAAAIFATSPADIGGVILDCDSGPQSQQWLTLVRGLSPADTPVRRIPAHISDDRLLGGLDLAATLSAGRPVVQAGLIAEANNGIIVLPCAERVSPATASRLANALDRQEVSLERDGVARRLPARFGIVAFNEGTAEDDRLPSVLSDRLALKVDLKLRCKGDFSDSLLTREQIHAARERLPSVSLGDETLLAICETASLLGVASLNVLLHAVRVARIVAALDGRHAVSENDMLATIRLVLAPHATRMPSLPDDQPSEPDQESAAESDAKSTESNEKQLRDVVLAAAKAALPPNLLSLLQSNDRSKSQRSVAGERGATRKSSRRGRPVGVKPGASSNGARLHVVETLRAAAPWQAFRRREQHIEGNSPRPIISVRAQDFRVWRLKNRGESLIIFIVDASGSTAIQRLAEAKGAVELLLADCYTRRDHVALVAFSGRGAELLLPPTRSLARAKRNLADLPGGGGTPIASGITTASLLCEAIKRKGQTPTIVMLTDGRANLCRDGKGGRARAEEEAITAAREVRAMRIASLVIDSSTKPQGGAARIAEAMGATYFPLPHADAQTLSDAVRTQMPRSRT